MAWFHRIVSINPVRLVTGRGFHFAALEKFVRSRASFGLFPALPFGRRLKVRAAASRTSGDLGEGLADEKRDGDARPAEWRTPPLWGIGLFPTVNGHERYLHDVTEAVIRCDAPLPAEVASGRMPTG